jgi:uncharacterized protein (TIGR02284 family)
MGNKSLIKKLTRLMQLEIDARHTYHLALDRIDDAVIRERMAEFEKQHEGHIEQLSKEIKILGGSPPDSSPDITGYLVEGVTALMSSLGATGALRGVKFSEDLTTRHYQDALKWDVPENINHMIRRHFTDEKIHLDYIANNLKALGWE